MRPNPLVHVIGGLADTATAADYQGFLRAAREGGVVGRSIYNWPVTPPGVVAALSQ